jgi:hypothetical protein
MLITVENWAHIDIAFFTQIVANYIFLKEWHYVWEIPAEVAASRRKLPPPCSREL